MDGLQNTLYYPPQTLHIKITHYYAHFKTLSYRSAAKCAYSLVKQFQSVEASASMNPARVGDTVRICIVNR